MRYIVRIRVCTFQQYVSIRENTFREAVQVVNYPSSRARDYLSLFLMEVRIPEYLGYSEAGI